MSPDNRSKISELQQAVWNLEKARAYMHRAYQQTPKVIEDTDAEFTNLIDRLEADMAAIHEQDPL